jgi:hypothetical protein
MSKEAPNYVYRLIHGLEMTEEDWSLIQANRIVVVQENDQ